ncbi:MAG TPA: 3'-5' exonuclease [Candidatus Saccharimonadales bacterium]|nr:3'-5' exonuclease [Candidatus Saccharimonadales bacterium]
MSILQQPLVFVDIETNGLSATTGRIIEVAAIRVEHGVVTKEYSQLLDPQTLVPNFITRLTGITQQDVANAPRFAHIAEELHQVLHGAIFVAHNVRFDYSFLQHEFGRVGKIFNPQLLCTVRLSRALYPEHRSHKLQNLIDRHGFTVTERHRAYDDAAVLWQFVQHVQHAFAPDVLQQALARQLA